MSVDAGLCRDPAIRLSGQIVPESYENFRRQLAQAPRDGDVVIEVSTPGGDPEVARMIGEDIRFDSQLAPGRRMVFLGKTFVYSAGATLMSYFHRDNRYLTSDTWLMIHERQFQKTLDVKGPLTACVPAIEAALEELKASIAIQREGFANLAAGSSISADDVERRARSAWYIEAQEALALGMVAGVL